MAPKCEPFVYLPLSLCLFRSHALASLFRISIHVAGNFKTRTPFGLHKSWPGGCVMCVCYTLLPFDSPPTFLPFSPLFLLPLTHAQADRAQTTCVLPSLAGKTTQRTKLCLSVSVRRGREREWQGKDSCVCVCVFGGGCLCICLCLFGFCFFVSPHGRRALWKMSTNYRRIPASLLWAPAKGIPK